MLNLRFLFTLIMICSLSLQAQDNISFTAPESVEEKPFERVMVFSGMTLNFSVFIGMFAAATDRGLAPDLIIASCGASIAAAIIKKFPNRNDQLNFIRSDDFYQFVKKIKLSKGIGTSDALSVLTDLYNASAKKDYSYLKEWNIIDFPKLDELFPEENIDNVGSLPIIIQSSEFRIQEVDKNSKYITQIYFTDDDTGKWLNNRQSAISKLYPEGHIRKRTKTISSYPMSSILRAAISDPIMFSPYQFEDKFYLTGAVDLYPYELASKLGEEVIMGHSVPFDKISEMATIGTFGYSARHRISSLSSFDINYWVDFSDFKKDYDLELIKLKISFLNLPLPGVTLNLPTILSLDSPRTLEDYRLLVNAQFAYGYLRMLESINKKGSMDHVRFH